MRLISNGQDGSEAPYAIAQLAKGHPETVARQWASIRFAPEFYGKFTSGV
ncbi:hypothetical protein [Streptomyces sp. NPDC056492]